MLSPTYTTTKGVLYFSKLEKRKERRQQLDRSKQDFPRKKRSCCVCVSSVRYIPKQLESKGQQHSTAVHKLRLTYVAWYIYLPGLCNVRQTSRPSSKGSPFEVLV